jgi:pyruvate dehydrogenase E2 component (dihydrolipoamide acetyltransferase)
MTESAAIPQFSVRKHVPMEGAMDAVRHLRDRGVAVTLTDVLLRATALTLVQHPELSAHYIGDAIRYFPAPVISLATDSPNGVIAPVLRSPERLSWSDLADQRRHIVEGARAGKLLPVNLNGGTFSLSNVGAVGGDAVVPLLTPPQVAILGVGAVRPSSAGAVSTMDLVVDHRALDGADAARFLVTLADLLRAGSPATSFDLEGA